MVFPIHSEFILGILFCFDQVTKFLFLANGFLFTCGILTLFFRFFETCFDFSGNGFPNSLTVRSRSSFRIVSEIL